MVVKCVFLRKGLLIVTVTIFKDYLLVTVTIFKKYLIVTLDLPYCCLSCGTEKISWFMLGELAIGQLTQHNPNDFVSSTGQEAIACVLE